mmetsp:Transcript_40673/g.63518  ORF Transcript_40673/g.63518 Transcript_40673/m.63518 type:complete len:122 (+) Transcript_40673:41-406(+)
MMKSVALGVLGMVAAAEAFAPIGMAPALRASKPSAITSLRMGAERDAPGPQGRGPFGPEDTFVLPDGREYQPGDAATDDLYGAALASPIEVDDTKKGILAAGFLGFAVLVPTILIKVVGGY